MVRLLTSKHQEFSAFLQLNAGLGSRWTPGRVGGPRAPIAELTVVGQHLGDPESRSQLGTVRAELFLCLWVLDSCLL